MLPDGLLSGIGFRRRVHPEFYPDMGEFLGIGEPAVTHHRPQRNQAGRGEASGRDRPTNQVTAFLPLLAPGANRPCRPKSEAANSSCWQQTGQDRLPVCS
jgi:hypothetical protein